MQKIVPLTSMEKDNIHRACEKLETGRLYYSCSAIHGRRLCKEYCHFYEKEFGAYWLSGEFIESNSKRNLRIILLLLFAEVGKIEGEPEL